MPGTGPFGSKTRLAGGVPRHARARSVLVHALLGAAALALAACQGSPSSLLDNPSSVDLAAKAPARVTARGDGEAQTGKAKAGRYEVFPGGTAATEDGEDPPPGVGADEDGKFTVNVDQASLAEAAKLILGETLGYNYVIDPRVQGSVTLVSNRALTARELLSAFEAALRLTGAALIQSEGAFKIVALQEVLDGEMGTADQGARVSSGYGVSAVPLRYISPANLMELMDSFIARSGSVRASKVGNMILLRGAAAERKALVDVVLSFDVDWMQTKTASMAMLENGRADDVAQKLQAIFADDTAEAGSNGIKVVSVPRINGIVVIAASPQKVKRALTWIKRLDRESITDPNFYVYAVQNGNAVQLASILKATFGSGAADAGASAQVAPDLPTVNVTMEAGAGGQAPQQGDQAQPRQAPAETGAAPAAVPDTAPSGSGGADGGQDIRITPNPSNNTIVIRATPQDYRKILATLRQIDAPATQVLINTTIAEVSLNNKLRYGVQAYLSEGGVGGGLFKDGAASTDESGNTLIRLQPTVPGMNFFVGSISSPQLMIDALSGVTRVRVVSSPSVLVLENETATIKVGDQVPIQSQKALTDGGTNLSSFEYRDTGVILKVKPRVTASGVVTIELGQELSAVQKSVGVGGNPKFTQRSITSKVSVNDQQTVLLGGLISGTETNAKDGVPGVNKLPVLGDVIGSTEKSGDRTELIVFITPKIIRNGEEAARESQELRDKMKNLNFN